MSDEPKLERDPDPLDDPPPSHPPVLTSGDVVGEYVIDRLVAAGGMAQIFLAHHEFTLRVVALKTPVRKLTEGSVGHQRMMAEARALGEIEHPNIVRIYHAGRDPKVGLYIVMELLEGKNLRELMRWTGGLPVFDALRYAIEIAEATHALHGLGIFHRDIKPENVFITKSRTLKLLDLGAAKIEKYGARTTGNMGTVGTTAYMSPEHLSFKPITAASDVYSLGVMTYEMLAKKHMFLVHRTTATPQEFRQWHLFAQPEPLNKVVEGVSEETARVIARALEKEPSDRYPDMEAFGNALRAALAHEMEARRVAETPAADAAEESSKKGKFGTDLMVQQIKASELKARMPQAAASPVRAPHVTPRTIKMNTVAQPPSDTRLGQPGGSFTPSGGVPANILPRGAEIGGPQRAALQATPSPVTVDDPAPRSGPKIALAVFAGLLVAVVAVIGLQLNRSTQAPTPSSSIAAAGEAPPAPMPEPTGAPSSVVAAEPAHTEEAVIASSMPTTEAHSVAPRATAKPAAATTARASATPAAPSPRPMFDHGN